MTIDHPGTLQGKTYKVGDLVVPDPAFWGDKASGVYEVTKAPTRANEKNYVAKPVDAEGNPQGGRGIRGPAYALNPYTPGQDTPNVTRIPLVATPPMGAVVKVTLPNVNPETLFVVLGDGRQPNTVRLAYLGGHPEGRYYPKMPVAVCAVVDPATLGA